MYRSLEYETGKKIVYVFTIRILSIHMLYMYTFTYILLLSSSSVYKQMGTILGSKRDECGTYMCVCVRNDWYSMKFNFPITITRVYIYILLLLLKLNLGRCRAVIYRKAHVPFKWNIKIYVNVCIHIEVLRSKTEIAGEIRQCHQMSRAKFRTYIYIGLNLGTNRCYI